MESLNNGHFGTNINSGGLSPVIILIGGGGIKFGNLVLSIVERYLIQGPFLGVSVKRDSTVLIYYSLPT